MKFWVLGSGTALPGDGSRGPAGFALELDGKQWWVDGGSGTLQRSAAHGIDPLTLSGGFYTHRHPDHCADLVPLLFALRIAGRQSPYPIVAGEGFEAHLGRLKDTWGRWISHPGGVVLTELPLNAPSTLRSGSLTVHAAPANHSAGALHYAFVGDGSRVVFSGDSAYSDALVELATGADLLVCECASSDEAPTKGHFTPSQLARLAGAARPREVWVTHLYPGVTEEAVLAPLRALNIPARRAKDGDCWSSP